MGDEAVLTKESWGDDILLKSTNNSGAEYTISRDLDLSLVQAFVKEFQAIHQQAKLVQEQLEGNSHILYRLKQKLKSHSILG
jgi:hypothetical protein